MNILSPEKIEELSAIIKELKDRDLVLERLYRKIEYLRAHNKERADAYEKILYYNNIALDQDRIAIQDSRSGEPEVPRFS